MSQSEIKVHMNCYSDIKKSEVLGRLLPVVEEIHYLHNICK
jgi:hypothetical protein